MTYTFIVNPAAGGGRAGRDLPRIEETARSAGLDFEVVRTSRARHAAELAHTAAVCGHSVVAVGGDGTVHEVARGLVESGRTVPLGLVPIGTGNDFAAGLGIPRRIDHAVRGLTDATLVPIDSGVVRWWEVGSAGVRQTPFVNAVGAGFDARVADEAARHKYLPGLSAYLAAVPRVLHRWVAPQVHISVGQGPGASDRYRGRLFLITAGNGTSSGGGFRLTPNARLDDGLLDICIVENLSLGRVLQLLPRALNGTHVSAPEVHMHRVAFVQIETATPVFTHADGEVLTREATRIEIEVVPAGLSVLVPRHISKRKNRYLIDNHRHRYYN